MGKSGGGGGDQQTQSRKAKAKQYYKKLSKQGGKDGGYGGSRGGQTGWGSRGGRACGSGWGGNKKTFFHSGMKGFLCTTNMRERECVLEAYNILNEYAPSPQEGQNKKVVFEDAEEDQGHKNSNVEKGDADNADCGDKAANSPVKSITENIISEKTCPEVVDDEEDMDDEDDDDDIDKALSKEIKDLKSYSSTRRFLSVDTGVKNVVFISTTVDDPNGLAVKIYEDVITKGEAICRNLLRFIPVAVTCLPNFDDIKESLKTILPKHLEGGFKSFKVEFVCRCNSKLEVSKGRIITMVNEIVTQINPMTFVDLQNPLYTIYIDVVNTVACLSVLSNFSKYRKYNLVEAAVPRPPAATTTKKCTEKVDIIADSKEVPSNIPETKVCGNDNEETNVTI